MNATPKQFISMIMSRKSLSFLVGLVLLCGLASSPAAEKGFSAEKSDKGVEVKLNGKLLTRYVLGEGNKPFLFPVIGPNGSGMTRAYPMRDVPGEKQDHPHHRGVWFGHQGVNGFDSWHEPKTLHERKLTDEKRKEALAHLAATVHREFKRVAANDKQATIVSVNDYVGADGTKLMSDLRRIVFREAKGKRYIDYDITLFAEFGDVTLKDMKDCGFNIRVPHSMTVDAKEGGAILNSRGDRDKDAWGKRAEWCAFYGPVDGKTAGIAMLNHPGSFRFPTPWHARTYGLFTANPFGTKSLDKNAEDGTITLKKGEKIQLKHRLVFHEGTPEEADIAGEYARYAKPAKKAKK